MTEQELKVLLYRRESESLDFKRVQYDFVKANDDQKAELLKDVLAFANSWRTEPAHILVGVEERPQPTVVGIPVSAHLDDHSLQQFVNTKTNRPVRLSYQRVEYCSLHVGVIRLEYPQQRPVFLSKPFGRLEARAVYIRRGSSTDLASPDEVFAMGRAEVENLSTPSIRLELADPARELHLGDMALVNCKKLLVRSPRESPPTPGLEKPRFGTLETLLAFSTGPWADEWKLKAAHIAKVAGFTPLRFWVFNDSAVNAAGVRIRMDVPQADGLTIVDEGDHPRWDSRSIARMIRRDSFGEPEVKRTEAGWRVEVQLPKLQPRSEYYTDPFYVRGEQEVSVQGHAQVFADNLPAPIPFPLQIDLAIQEQDISYDAAEDLLEQLRQ